MHVGSTPWYRGSTSRCKAAKFFREESKALRHRRSEKTMSKTVTTPWDPAEHLHTEEEMAAYLEAALEDSDPALIAAALGDVARAKRITSVAREKPCPIRPLKRSIWQAASVRSTRSIPLPTSMG